MVNFAAEFYRGNTSRQDLQPDEIQSFEDWIYVAKTEFASDGVIEAIEFNCTGTSLEMAFCIFEPASNASSHDNYENSSFCNLHLKLKQKEVIKNAFNCKERNSKVSFHYLY